MTHPFKKGDNSNNHPDIYFYIEENKTSCITGCFVDMNTDRK